MSEPAAVAGGIPLGGFRLDAQIGGGGHGLVWRGVHKETDLPVAVKVLPPTADRLALHGIKNEVQAIARLHHPHVVAILDTGLVSAETAAAAERAGRPLSAGSPWIALELASGGDLANLVPPLPFALVSDVMRTLFTALSHAHARGVVHRDIKPANVLLCADDDVRPGLKLTDFGIAQWERGQRIAGGTPLFMAPEQFDIDGRDVGPWTDLYALGCVAQYLMSGEPPFIGETWRALEKLHRTHAPRPFNLPADAPKGVSEFLNRMLEKDPALRFRCAADADAALAQLDRHRAAPPTDRLPDDVAALVRARVNSQRSLTDAATVKRHSSRPAKKKSSENVTRPKAAHAAPEATTQPARDVGAVPMPSSWRRQAPLPQPDLRLVEAGLSLWGMRPVPLVGRENERDALWQALLDVHAARAPRLVALRGPSGVGKSRVAEWVCHRADELGAARVLRAQFSENPARSDGFAGMVGRLTQLHAGDDHTALHARRWGERWLGTDELLPDELCALAGLADGVFPSSHERHGALVRLLSSLARERPLLIWLDDVHWSSDALAFLERVLDGAPELRVLFVSTAVDELLSADAAARLAALCERQTALTLVVGPLDETSHHQLCRLLLGGAASDLADDLRRRTEGNPMFAVHMVGDWVQRGLLEVRPGGLALRPGAVPAPPDALFRLWDQRLGAVFAASSFAEAERALELAAVLGSAVDLVEWEAACALPREQLDQLVDALVGAGLCRRTDAGFVFVHVMVRGSVERRAQARIADHHRRAAEALQLLWGTETPIAAARIGRHLLAAGDAPRAAHLLLRAAQVAVDEGEVLEAASVLVDFERARAAIGWADDDARASTSLLLRARVALAEGRPGDARALARLVQSASEDARLRTQAACVEGRAALGLPDIDAAQLCFERARGTADATHDRAGLGAALLGLGEVEYYRGNHGRCAEHYREATAILKAVGKKHDVAQLLWALGYVELEAGRAAAARRLFEEQRTLCRAIRDRLGEANAENALGELARRAGDLKSAETHYRVATRLATRSGLSRRWMFRLNLAHTKVAAGDLAGGALIAGELLNAPVGQMIATSCWWIVALEAAVRGDLPIYDKAATEAIALGSGPFVEEDHALAAQSAGDAISSTDRDRAERAWAFAREKWRALGKTPPGER